ncbi:MAG: hypothetical protein LBS60_08435 [Deltaproteobacteria bacterium]|jgi:hypothetical protein|nr:hypothetical protein [Deltaproteobacteria bacterium]
MRNIISNSTVINKKKLIKDNSIRFIEYIDNKLLYIAVLCLLLLLCLYILHLQSIVPPQQVTIADDSDTNINESFITIDDQRTYYSSKFVNGRFKGSFKSPWYIADKDFAVDIGGWLGHHYLKNNAEELQIFIEGANNQIYQLPVHGVSRLYYNTQIINLSPNTLFKFRIITKGDSSEAQGWLSFSAPYYPVQKKLFSNFLIKTLDTILFIIFILSLLLFIYTKGNKVKFILILCGLSCYFIVDFTPIGIVPYTPRSNSAQRIFITNDGAGYYLYLQEIFIEGFQAVGAATSVNLENGRVGNVYPIGVALLETPFFLMARSISNLASLHLREGLNDIFQLFSAISSAFYFIIGIYFIYKLIYNLTNYKNRIIIILCIIFGTNLLFYASGSWGLNYTHIYSFALLSIFLYLIPVFYSLEGKIKFYYSLLIGILIGIITMTRLQNCLFVIVFLLYNVKDLNEIKQRLFKYLPYFIISLFVSLVAFFPQAYWWYTHTGRWLINLYSESGQFFNWTNPQILNFTFSVHKGLFFWTPLWLFGYLAIFIKDPLASKWRFSLFIFLLFKIYMCSSWSWWWYGGSFGQREYADILGLLAIGLIINFNYLSQISKKKNFILRNSLKIFTTILIILVIINLVFLKGIIQGYIPFDYANINNIYMAFKMFI